MRALIPLLVAASLVGCDDSSKPPPASVDEPSTTAATSAVIKTYAARVEAAYELAAARAEALEAASKALVAGPTEATLKAARAAWLAARQAYAPTEAFRFVDGPIDGEGGPERLINAWPIAPETLDYVAGQPTAGLVQDPRALPEITPDALAALHQQGGEASVTVGFHAIEFLLWGQDRASDGPGARTHEDYLEGEMDHAARRGAYLLAASAHLSAQLRSLAAAWAPGAAYRVKLEAEGEVAAGKILTALATLAGTLAAERLAAPLEAGDPAREPNRFSDSTLPDLLANLAGLRAVLEGERGALELLDADGRSQVQGALAAAQAAVEAIPAPFDQALLSETGKPKIEAAIAACEALASAIVTAGQARGLAVEGR